MAYEVVLSALSAQSEAWTKATETHTKQVQMQFLMVAL